MRAEKTQILNDVGNMLSGSEYIFMCTYKGLKVKEISELRKLLAQQKAICKVLKNRIVRKAAEQKGIAGLSDLKIAGDTAFIFGKGDASQVAKVIVGFAKTHQPLSPKMGLLDGALIKAEDVKAVSEMPPLNVLRAQLLGLLQAPGRNLVTILNTKASEIVNVLNAFKNKLEENK